MIRYHYSLLCVLVLSGQKPTNDFRYSILGARLVNDCKLFSGQASPTFSHANANFSVFMDRIRNQKEINNDNDLNLHSRTKLSSWLRCWSCQKISSRLAVFSCVALANFSPCLAFKIYPKPKLWQIESNNICLWIEILCIPACWLLLS